MLSQDEVYVSIVSLLIMVGMAVYVRTVWTTLLAFLAGMSMACSRTDVGKSSSDSSITNTSKPSGNEEMQPTCYMQVEKVSAFATERWQEVAEMEEWARTARAVLITVSADDINGDLLVENIERARDAYFAAQVMVERGLLQEETYQLAGNLLIGWFDDLGMNHSGIKCYSPSEKMPEPPDLVKVRDRLEQLERLRRDGKLNAAAAEEARNAIPSALEEARSQQVSDELSLLLTELMGYE